MRQFERDKELHCREDGKATWYKQHIPLRSNRLVSTGFDAPVDLWEISKGLKLVEKIFITSCLCIQVTVMEVHSLGEHDWTYPNSNGRPQGKRNKSEDK